MTATKTQKLKEQIVEALEEGTEARYIRNFERKVWGFEYVFAKTKQEAQEKFDEGDYEIYDNKEDTEYEDIERDRDDLENLK